MKRILIAFCGVLAAYYFAVSVTWDCVYQGRCGSVFDSEVFDSMLTAQSCNMVTMNQHCLTIQAAIIVGSIFAGSLFLWGLRFGYWVLFGVLAGAGLLEAYYWFGVHYSLHFDPRSNISLYHGIWVGLYFVAGSFLMLLIMSGLFRRVRRRR